MTLHNFVASNARRQGMLKEFAKRFHNGDRGVSDSDAIGLYDLDGMRVSLRVIPAPLLICDAGESDQLIQARDQATMILEQRDAIISDAKGERAKLFEQARAEAETERARLFELARAEAETERARLFELARAEAETEARKHLDAIVARESIGRHRRR